MGNQGVLPSLVIDYFQTKHFCDLLILLIDLIDVNDYSLITC